MKRSFVALCVIALCWTSAAAQTVKVGLLGDSITDEYRADDNRGGSYAATTFNWLELLVAHRPVDPGPWGVRAYPRRTGYERNWARSGARAADVLTDGQAAGLAVQVAAGDVAVAVLIVGSNDFDVWNGTYAEVYNGTVTGPALTAKIDGIVASVMQTIDTVKAAGTVEMLVANLTDRGNTPSFLALFPDPAKRQVVSDAIKAVNAGIASGTAARAVRVIDLYGLAGTLLGQVDQQGNLIVGGEQISLVVSGDEPHHVLLGDSEHAGTVFSAVMANYIMDSLEADGGPVVTRFTDAEKLHNAGIYPIATYTPATLSVLQGTLVAGSLSSLASNDNVYLQVRSTASGSIRTAEIENHFTGVTAPALQLKVTVRAKASVTGAAMGVSFYNVVTGTWSDPQVGYFNLGTSETASTVTMASNAGQYVDGLGQVQVQLLAGRPVNATYTVSVDEVSLTSQ